jgi:putative ABC transport system permease protein
MITGEAVCSGKTDDGAGIRDSIEKMMSGTNRHLDGFYSSEADIREMKSSALVQITNGLFTVDFLVTLFLCVLGFMIYWISSIRDREMLFGIYRAMGITFNEIEKMLFIEQAFLTIVSVIAGAVSGVAATILFGRLFAVVYLPKKHSLPIENVTAMSDMVRLFVILAFAVAVCMVIIRRIVKRLNVVMALKLGED